MKVLGFLQERFYMVHSLMRLLDRIAQKYYSLSIFEVHIAAL